MYYKCVSYPVLALGQQMSSLSNNTIINFVSGIQDSKAGVCGLLIHARANTGHIQDTIHITERPK